MKERVFLDTNVLVYLFDADDPAKQRRVQDLLSNRGKLSGVRVHFPGEPG